MINDRDFTGQKFTRLTAVRFSHKDHRNRSYWLCKCDCGTEHLAAAYNLANNAVKSCGCLRRDRSSEVHKTHGMSDTPIYHSWSAMHGRCYNKNNQDYKTYGARGIIVCERWHTFENFYADMASTWFSGGSVERKDVDKNYEPSNCIWIFMNEQSKNRTISIKLESPWGYLGSRDIEKILGLKRGSLWMRMRRWPKERWFEFPRNHQ